MKNETAIIHYLRQFPVSMWNGALREKFNFFNQLVLTNFHFWRRTEYWAIILWSLEIFLIFPNFLKSLSRSATREATCIYQFITNNHTSFRLLRDENLPKHQKFSKYYENDCGYQQLSWVPGNLQKLKILHR